MAIAQAGAEADVEIDWTACELIERVPGKVSGKPVVVGTRIMPDVIVGSFDMGQTIEDTQDGLPALSLAQITRLIEYGHEQLRRAAR